MMQPDFAAMSRKELRVHVLQHRDDTVAFRALVDRLLAEPPKAIYPAPQSVEDLQQFPEVLEIFHRDQKEP